MVEDPALLERVVAAGVALEVCPTSNVALGVHPDLTSVPVPTLVAAGATVALGADDPLLFGSRLAGQYATMRAAHDLDDAALADLGAMSIRAARMPEWLRDELLAEVAAGTPWDESCRRANAAAAIKVTRRGPESAPTAAEVDAFLASVDGPAAQGPDQA